MVRYSALRGLAIGLGLAVLASACSGDAPDLGPNDPEALAIAAGLGEPDLPEGNWESITQTRESLFPTPDPESTPFPLPPELESCEFLQSSRDTAPTPPPSMSAAHGMMFFEPRRSAGDLVVVTTHVFATGAAAQAAFSVSAEQAFAEALDASSEECQRAIAALQAGVSDGSAIFVRREREPDFAIRGVEIRQTKTTLSSSAGVETSLSTTAFFARGHVVAYYQANETEEGTIDHERLIRTYIQRVTDAQLADRALAED